MRTATLGILLIGLTPHAQDDYYQRQLEQRRYDDARREAQRLEAQRIQNQQLEAQRQRQQLEQQQYRQRQDRMDQEAADQRWEAQQQQRRDSIDQQFAAQKQRQDAAMQLALQTAMNRQKGTSPSSPNKNENVGAGCEPLRIPQQQSQDDFLTGYFTPEKQSPVFLTVFKLGERGSLGKFTFEAHLLDGVLPTEVDRHQVRLSVWFDLKQSDGKFHRFRAVSGTAEYSSAVQSKKGRLQVELIDLVFVEMDDSRFRPKSGGKCFVSSRFTVDSNWNHADE